MSSCQTFRDTLGKIKTEDLQGLLDTLMSSPSDDTEKAIAEKLQAFKEQSDAFILDYRAKARKVLARWYSSDDQEQEEFLDYVRFEKDNLRVVFWGNLKVPGQTMHKASYFPSLIRKVEGNIDISKTVIKSMDYLEEAEEINATGVTAFQSMKRLRKTGNLSLERSGVIALDALEEADKIIATSFANPTTLLSSLKSLRKVGYLLAEESQLTSLDALEEAGDLRLQGSRNLTSLASLRKAHHIDVRQTSVSDLDALEVVGYLNALRTPIRSLINLRHAGDLLITGTGITDLDKLEEVDGKMAVSETPLSSAVKLRNVGGDLNIAETKLTSLPSLEAVGGGIIIHKIGKRLTKPVKPIITNLASFLPNLKKVGKLSTSRFSFEVLTREERRQLEDMRAQGKILFDSPIFVAEESP